MICIVLRRCRHHRVIFLNMGAVICKQIERLKAIAAEKKILQDLLSSAGDQFPGCEYQPDDRKAWMAKLDPNKLKVNQIVWPGTHDSGTDKIGIMFVTRPFAQCQSCSIYQQLVMVCMPFLIKFYQTKTA